MRNRLWSTIRFIIALISALVLLFPILMGILLILWIVDIPRKVGRHLAFEDAIRTILFKVFDPEKMQDFRDDVLHIVESEIDDNQNWERWGLLRGIETAQDEIEKILKDGEFAFTFLGG